MSFHASSFHAFALVTCAGILISCCGCGSDSESSPTASAAPNTKEEPKTPGPPLPPAKDNSPDPQGPGSSAPEIPPPGGRTSSAPPSAGPTGKQATDQKQSTQKLRNIGLALHNYHDVVKAFPAGYSVSDAGEPLLSWRVHVLPFLEELELYKKFRLNEPWNSQHNQALIAEMPDVYRSPSSSAEPGKTTFLGNAVEGGIFVPPPSGKGGPQHPQGNRMRDISDGTSNTIMLVEADDASAVIWTKPSDFRPANENPFAGLLNRSGHKLVLLCDGSYRTIDNSQLNDPESLDSFKGLFTRSGGEPPPGY